MKELTIRSISGLIGLIITVFVTSKGGFLLSCLVLILSLIGLYEFYRALEYAKYYPVKIIGYLFAVTLFFMNLDIEILSLDFIITTFLTLLLVIPVFKRELSLNDIAVTFLSIFYIPFFLNHIVFLDRTEYIWLVYIIAWGTDTCAYLFGNLFGKKKLCPNISPNKTVGGSLGGVLGSILLTMFFSKLMNLGNTGLLFVLAIVVSIMAQLGDLAASKIKRLTDIKDFGNIIPGHGGVLDRFDSILLTAPAVYYYVKYFLV